MKPDKFRPGTLWVSFILFAFFGCHAIAQDSLLFERKNFIQKKDTLPYRILYPNNFNKDASYPLVLFLHGSGERGNDNTKQLTHGSSLLTNPTHREDFPAIVIFPQCPPEDYWSNVIVDRSSYPVGLKFQYDKGPTRPLELVMSLIDETLANSYVDNNQVYVMGLSMGGMGTYELLFREPDVFAAAVSICGAGNPESTKKWASKVPLWAFHGAKDNVVNPQHSISMVSAVLKEGGFPSFTLYDDAGHNSWNPAFDDPDLLPWLFSHSLKN